jgi:MarR family transcriptional regulator, organic hydroperoxide resistance regulator
MSEHRQGGFLIAKIHRTGGRIFARMLRERGMEINPAHGRVLFVLWQEGSMAINELAKRVSLGKSTLTNTIDRLEAAGQIVRVRSVDDRRKILIELTPKNRALHRLYDDVSAEMTRLFYQGFSKEDAARFDAYLARVLANLAGSEHRLAGARVEGR